jgi:sulfate adenylyltransferase
MVMAQGEYNLAGPIKVLSDGGFPAKFGDLYMKPVNRFNHFQLLCATSDIIFNLLKAFNIW